MFPTPYPALNQILGDLTSRMLDILGGDLIGAYLQGSFALGDFDEHSDVDFIVAIQDDLTSPQVGRLQVMHDQVYQLDSEWAKHLEGSYFPRGVVKDHSMRGIKLWYLDHGARHLIRSDHCNTALVRAVVRERGLALYGPPPATLVDPISAELLRTEILETLTRWGQEILEDPDPYRNRFYQGFIVVSYCRMLRDLHTGSPGSKREGAEWAKSVLNPSWSTLIDGAWDSRPDPAQKVQEPADPEDFERTLRFVAHIIEESGLYAQRANRA